MPKTVVLLTELCQRERVIERLQKELKCFNVPQHICLDIQLAITEAINNAFIHGCKKVPCPRVIVQWLAENGSIQIQIKDNGPGFRYNEVDLDCEKELFKEEGRGIFLICHVLDKVWFNNKGNEMFGLKKW